jgi:hypothetical protein
MNMRDRYAKADSLACAVFKDNAHVSTGLLPPFADAVDVPTAAHQHVCDKNATAGKIDEHPLAARFDAVDMLASERRVVVEAREQRVIRTEAGDGPAGEGAAQCARGAKDGIAFGHSLLLDLVHRGRGHRQRNAAQVHAEGA